MGLPPVKISPEEQKIIDQFALIHWRQWNTYPRQWMGVKLVKFPTDLFIYQMLMYENKPDFVIETGAYLGGGALYLAHICEMIGHGHVISVDRRKLKRRQHPRLTYVIGRSTETETLNRIHEMVDGHTCMVILDSDHTANHVKREMRHYGKMVTKGQYMIVEDTFLGTQIPWGRYVGDNPKIAVDWYMARNDKFEVVPLEERFCISMAPGGFLRRK